MRLNQDSFELSNRDHSEKMVAIELENARVLMNILSIVAKEDTFEELLNQAIDELLSVSWLKIMPKGGIFIVNEGTQTLQLYAKRNLPPTLYTLCSKVPFGHCLCGRAAATQEVQYAKCIDGRHDIRYDNMTPHGHYSVPLVLGSKLMGVLVVYLPHGHDRDEIEVTFLLNVAKALGLLIQVKNKEYAMQKAKEAAQKANDAKTNFLASMSHDLRTPLNAIMGFSQMIKNKIYGDQIEGKNEEYINLVLSSSKRILLLIDGILDLSKVESGEYILDEEDFDANALIEELANEFSEISKIYGVNVKTVLNSKDVKLMGEKKAISQIFQNVTSNALKFSPDSTCISIFLSALADGRLSLKIIDQGSGFSPRIMKHIAEPFFVDDAHVAQKDKSTGLGLYITKRFAEMHGAEFILKNEPGSGACVEIIFPSERISL